MRLSSKIYTKPVFKARESVQARTRGTDFPGASRRKRRLVTSGETWRPLPRRELSERDGYDVLIGTNTHIVLPTGWVQEEHNVKAVLAGLGETGSAEY